MRTIRERASRPLLALATGTVTIALTGCVTFDAELSVRGDTVSGMLVAAIHQEVAEELELDPEQLFSGAEAAFPDLSEVAGISDAPYDDGDWSGTEYTLDEVRLADLNEVTEDNPEGLQIIRDQPAGRYEFALVMDLSGLDELDPPPDSETPAPDLSRALDSFEIAVEVTFPGEVLEHNGELDGTTVSWRPEPGDRAELRAVASDPDADPNAPPPPGTDDDPEAAGDPAAAGDDADSAGSGRATALVAGLAVLLLATTGLGAGWLVRRRRPATALAAGGGLTAEAGPAAEGGADAAADPAGGATDGDADPATPDDERR